MSKREKAWRMFLIQAYAINQGGTIPHCAYEADRLLAEYDKRFPTPTKELTVEPHDEDFIGCNREFKQSLFVKKELPRIEEPDLGYEGQIIQD